MLMLKNCINWFRSNFFFLFHWIILYLYRSNFYETIDRANLWIKKKNALYHKTLKINVNDLNCIGFVHTFFPFLFLCPSINFFYSLNDDKHMHVAVSIFFLRNHWSSRFVDKRKKKNKWRGWKLSVLIGGVACVMVSLAQSSSLWSGQSGWPSHL